MAKRRIGLLLLMSLLLIGCDRAGGGAPQSNAQKQKVVTISKETTFVTGPLTEDGFVDYISALNQLSSKGVTPQNNAAVLYCRALGPIVEGRGLSDEFFRLLGIPKPPGEGAYLVNFAAFVKQQGEVAEELSADVEDDPHDMLDRAMAGPWKPQDLPQIAAWLKANEESLKLVVEGTRRDKYYWPLMPSDDFADDPSGGLIATLLPDAQATRSFARALACRAMLSVEEGRFDDAWRNSLACHRLARQVGTGPTLIAALVGMAIDQIACRSDQLFFYHSKPSLEKALQYRHDLRSLAPLPDVAPKINYAERFMFLDSVAGLAQGKTSGLAEAADSIDALSRFAASAFDWDEILRMGNKWYDRLYEALSEPDRRVMARKLADYERELQELTDGLDNKLAWGAKLLFSPRIEIPRMVGRILIALFLPAAGAAQAAEDRAHQVLRNTEIALALAAHHTETGRYPTRLRELTPRFLGKIPDDIFSGKPLHYSVTDDGYLLYSVGQNGKDDQGRWYADEPSGDDPRVRTPP